MALVRGYLDGEKADTSSEAFILDDVGSYLGAFIGDDVEVESPPATVSVSLSDTVKPALGDAVADTGFADIDEATRHTLADLLGAENPLPVALGRLSSLVEAVVESPAYPIGTPREIVEAAILRKLEKSL